jgi:hypothetical protein
MMVCGGAQAFPGLDKLHQGDAHPPQTALSKGGTNEGSVIHWKSGKPDGLQ